LNETGQEADTGSSVTSRQQIEAEALVRELWSHPLITAARTRSRNLMLGAYGIDVPKEAMRTFEGVMDEYAVSYLVRTVSRDRDNSRLVWNYNPPFERDGREVRGSRFCGDNPDSYYRFAGIDPGERYRIAGRPGGPEGPSISFNLMRNWGGTDVGPSLDLEAAVREADGSFVLTIDPNTAGGRANHLQSDEATCILIVRECLSDWANQVPLHLTIEREGAKPGTQPDLDRMARDAARWIVHEIPLYFWMIHLFRNLPPNTARAPMPTADYGGHGRYTVSQAFCQFADDECVLVRWDPADSVYSSITVNDWWFRQIDAHRIQSSLNSHQAAIGSDGAITAVISARDPGIVNWIETDGLHDLTPTIRWQGVPERPPRNGPQIVFERVTLQELDRRLPPDIARISRAERDARNQARLAAFMRRAGPEGTVKAL
jgi:hypothetical protein